MNNELSRDGAHGIQVPALPLISPAIEVADPVPMEPRIVASARAVVSAATHGSLCDVLGLDEIDVQAGTRHVLRIAIAPDHLRVTLIEADALGLFDPAPRFPDGRVRRALTLPWTGPRRLLVRKLHRLGRERIAFTLNDREEVQFAFGPNRLHVAVVATLAEGDGLFREANPMRLSGASALT